MYIEHAFLPDSTIGEMFNLFIPDNYIYNAWIAKNAACFILKQLLKLPNLNIMDYIDVLKIGKRHILINTTTNDYLWINKLIKYCSEISENQLQQSTFRDQVMD
jgi:hypothetical protein